MKRRWVTILALTLAHCGDDKGSGKLDATASETTSEDTTNVPDSGDDSADDASHDATADDTEPAETTDDDGTSETSPRDTTPSDTASDTAPLDTTPDTPEVPPPPPGETCATALRIAAPGVVEGTLVGARNDYDAWSPTCSGPQGGPDQVHVITVPPGQRLLVTIAPGDNLPTYGLYLVAGHAAACDALPTSCSGSSYYVDHEVHHWVNASADDVDVFIVVDTAEDTTVGSYTLDVALDTPPVGDTCASATPVAIAGTASESVVLGEQTFAGLAVDYVAADESCLDARTPDRVYVVSVPSGKRLSATIASQNAIAFALVKGPAAACEGWALDCVSMATADEGPVTIVTSNASNGARDVFVVVKPIGAADALFELTLALTPSPPGDGCDDPIAVDAQGLSDQATAGYVTDVPPSFSCGWDLSGGADRTYRVTVPAHQRMSFTVTPSGKQFLPHLRVMTPSECGSQATCLTGAKALEVAAEARWTNRGNAPTDVVVVVGGFASSGSGTFAIELAFDDPPAGDTCADATPIGPGNYPSESTIDFTPDLVIADHTNAVCFGRDRDRVYQVVVPPMSRIVAEATSTGAAVNLEVVPGPAANCLLDPMPCVESNAVGNVAHIAWSNQGAADATVFLIAGGDAEVAAGNTFDLTVDVTPLPEGDLCTTATKVDGNAKLTGQTTTGYTNDYAGGNYCGNSGGADREYVVTVPNDTRLDVTVTPTTSWNPAVELLADEAACASDRRCLTTRNVGSTGQSEAAWYYNHSGHTQTIIASIDSSDLSAGDFALEVKLADWPRPAGDTCASATPLEAGKGVSGQTNDGYANDYLANSLACGGFGGTGGDRVYLTTIPPKQQLSVTLTPTGSFAFLWMYLVTGDAADCEATPLPCLSGDTTLTGPRTLTAVNPGPDAMPLFIVVDGGFYDSLFAYSLETSLSDAP